MTTAKHTEFIFFDSLDPQHKSGGLCFGVGLFFLIFIVALLPLSSASPFGYDIDDTPGTYNYYVNESVTNNYYGSINGTLDMQGYTINNSGNIIPNATSTFSIGNSLLRWLTGWFVTLDVSQNITTKNLNASGDTKLNNVIVLGNFNASGNIRIDGNVSIKRPYGMFSSIETLTVPSINTAYTVNWSNTEINYLVSISNDRKNFSVAQSGVYLVEISIIVQSSTPGSRAYIWVRKNGVNIARSTTIYDFKGTNANSVISAPFLLDLNTSDNFQIMYAGDNNGVKLQYLTNTSFSPETPSSIITITKSSELAS